MSDAKYEAVIGLEVHVQMKTKSKMFCGCSNDSDNAEPNTNICEVCTGQPGTLPRLNEQSVVWGVRTALALGCTIPEQSKFDRKNYFYPDLPKGYQISQFDEPVGENGKLIITINGERKRIGIERLHLEEDAGKLTHASSHSKADYNRAGTPLMEIVSKPDIRTPEEAKVYLQEMRTIMRYLGVSDADMEKGHMRADGNISIRKVGENELNEKVEIKNVNSFKNIERALQHEFERQIELWENGERAVQETRGFDPNTGETTEQRSKEGSADYRYFPEPDIPPLEFSTEFVEEQRTALPELPDPKRQRFVEQFGVSVDDAVTLSASMNVAEFFENTRSEARSWLSSKLGKDALNEKADQKITKLCVNWITTELFKLLKEHDKTIDQLKITPENMAEFIAMVYNSEINSSAAQTVLAEMVKAEDFEPDPSVIVEEKNLKQMTDSGEIESVVEQVLKDHAEVVEQVRAGKENGLQFLVGQAMKATQGKANPPVVQELLRKKILG